jgi:hypothetical protein
MAMHRQHIEAETPAELLEFKPEEWESPDDSGWWPAFERWKTARAWLDCSASQVCARQATSSDDCGASNPHGDAAFARVLVMATHRRVV